MRPLPAIRALACCCMPVLLLALSSAQAANYRVGSGCQYATIQAALDASLADDGAVIELVRGTGFGAQQLVVEYRRVEIAGGYPDCSSATTSGQTLVSGQGGASTSVLSIRNEARVTLRNLTIAFGDDSGSEGHGGGIDFRASGELRLFDTFVTQNEAAYGGGINFDATGEGATLIVGRGTRISNNTARVSGGGLRLEGKARLVMTDADVGIVGNLAISGYGGGIQLLGPATAEIGSNGYELGGEPRAAISDNEAAYGGGIAAISLDYRPVSLRLFSTDALRPVRLHRNRARNGGGAIYVSPNGDFYGPATARLQANDFRIDGNFAPEGAAILADTDATLNVEHGVTVLLNRSALVGSGGALPPGATTCRAGPGCNSIDGNLSETATGVATDGAIVLIRTDGALAADRVQWRGNVGGHALRANDAKTLRLAACAFHGNTSRSTLIHSGGSARLQLRGCTVAHNAIGGTSAIASGGGVQLLESILYEAPGMPLVAGDGTREVMHVLASERGTLDGGASPFVISAEPRFIDPERGDFQLQVASPAVDAAPWAADLAPDLAGQERGRGLPVVADRFGPLDLGAYERQAVGNLALNPDFAERPGSAPEPLRLWSTVPGTSATWTSEGALGSIGSVYISYLPPIVPTSDGKGATVSFAGLRQCVHVPGPGVYALNAHARVPGALATSRDHARLRWTFRRAAADCSGAAHAQGDHFLPRSSTWATSMEASSIAVAPGEWTSDSTLELSLEVSEGDVVASNAIDAYFDSIRLTVVGLEVPQVFADGFDD